jgi:hypothetical protein
MDGFNFTRLRDCEEYYTDKNRFAMDGYIIERMFYVFKREEKVSRFFLEFLELV